MRPGTSALHDHRRDWVGPVAWGRLRSIHTHRLLEWKGTAGCACRDRHHPTRRFELSSVASKGRAGCRSPVSLALPAAQPEQLVAAGKRARGIGLHQPGLHDVDVDALAAHFERQVARQALERRLGGAGSSTLAPCRGAIRGRGIAVGPPSCWVLGAPHTKCLTFSPAVPRWSEYCPAEAHSRRSRGRSGRGRSCRSTDCLLRKADWHSRRSFPP